MLVAGAAAAAALVNEARKSPAAQNLVNKVSDAARAASDKYDVQARVNNSGNDMTKNIIDFTGVITKAVNDLKTSTNPDGLINTIQSLDNQLKTWAKYQTNSSWENMKITAMIAAARSFVVAASMVAIRLDDSHMEAAQKSLESLEKTIQSFSSENSFSGYSDLRCRCERCGLTIIR